MTTSLRRHGVLCTASEREIWLFGTVPQESMEALRSYDLDLIVEGNLTDHAILRTATGQPIKSALLDAIEAAVRFQLAGIPSVTHVGPYTWLVDICEENGKQHSEGLLLRLRLRFLDDGTLYATINTRPSPLSPVRTHVDAGTSVILAPSGQRAMCLGDESVGTPVVDSDQWRSLVAASLQVEVGDCVEWTRVQSLDDELEDCFIWPANLCFEHKDRSHLDSGKCNWRSCFRASEGETSFTHPLTVAEDWLAGATERAAAVERMRYEAMDDDELPSESTAGDEEGEVTTSPPLIQRTADQQATIYPTPPDVLLLAQSASQQMGPENSANSSALIDPTSFGADLLHTSDDIEPRQLTSSSSNQLAAQRGNDDLFGDLSGELDFGTGEVGDEDFDFFNEEDDATAAAAMGDDNELLEVEDGDADIVGAGGDHASDAVDIVAAASRAQQAHNASAASIQQVESALIRVDDELFAESPPVELATDTTQAISQPQPDEPLSPFGIRERLLPPPVPASVKPALPHTDDLRRNAFNPLAFRADLEIGRRFSAQYGPGDYKTYESEPPTTMDTSLPSRRKKPRMRRPLDSDSDASEFYSESEEDSYESASSVSDENMPPKAPWTTKKRKRADYEQHALSGELQCMLRNEASDDGCSEEKAEAELQALLQRIAENSKYDAASWPPTQMGETFGDRRAPRTDALHPPERALSLTKLDLVYTAQLVSEQAITCVPYVVEQLDWSSSNQDNDPASGSAVHTLVDHLIEQLLPDTTRSDITRLALPHDPPGRAVTASSAARPGQPRPPQRSDVTSSGPDIVAVPPPFVRVQRGNDDFEMLPPALDFWEALSLAPTNGPKNIRAYCVCPLNDDLQRLTNTFLRDLGIRYEDCKLGSHTHVRYVNESNHLDEYEDGLAPVEPGVEDSIEGAMRAYAGACMKLGEFLATIGADEPDRTIVVYFLSPFPREHRVMQTLCACFWLLCKEYREHTPKALRNEPQSDVILQILPIEVVAAPDALVMLDAKQFGALAKEVYDRCPPALDGEQDITSALSSYAAPLVELASPPPKRIGFQLTAQPPNDLLHEGSSLHVAYALSSDGLWLTAAWVDSTGHYQSCSTYCLRGRAFANAASEVWERTKEILAGREVTWRVFIIASGVVNESYKNCWREIIARPRKYPFSVTLLSAQLDLDLKLSPPPTATPDERATNIALTAVGFLTPVSTPQATTTMTFPSDTSGNAAPPTPAPSDTALPDSDPDAHLIDTADESWAVLFPPTTYTAITSLPAQTDALAHGALFKRGGHANTSPICNKQLASLGVSLLWTVQVRTNGNVDAGSVKQAEMTLREVLRMFRGLSVLTRARGLVGNGGEGMCLPVHMVGAVRGAEALDGYL
ncbi:mediator of RNA polymerase II transcription subunit 13 [Friedmanniomyces endolithicus]|uniref:Mediator of RNA polymerase II transcription subunit 13 n=1 Tax=Friedmanniomyces endolithicus TaxID=329885 RepID=A0AAN6L2W0_9PEZI|nr:mediator of RNA polymerase II transcription subunit 13 [Friedmanniomyces endolithicus]KAK1016369.1 mediator of RNA polymerase II transcription subunit 13 [Friedmanniomyces endolithicus]